ncbi:redox-sensitive transcriptional activator SoxR [Frankia sp. AiPs1]|uniref:redox-sensitive transcriptional activator SoxR n=1 Tax=Frankia sp. AiPs1 TaxID=573493 RepID=UPI00204434FC|nr:redox-sensitive transcriptional activator SoxR [Frankia sp. AiPs1]MCM3920973.1 redox-sensitive transcriptional activator SoxR [Frankia sp. AiPs1]
MTRDEDVSIPIGRKELSIGEMAQRIGVSVSTLHFYESKGLISARRTAGNQRRYDREILRRIAFVRAAQRFGIPLNEIVEVLRQLPEGRTPTRQDWAVLSENWRSEIDRRMEDLRRLRENITDCIGCGCLSIARCALVNPEDEYGRRGPGAHRLLRGDTDPS